MHRLALYDGAGSAAPLPLLPEVVCAPLARAEQGRAQLHECMPILSVTPPFPLSLVDLRVFMCTRMVAAQAR